MAMEFPNTLEAAGIFDGKAVPVFPNPILNSDGVQPFDPTTDGGNGPSTIKGGFTRVFVPPAPGVGTLLFYAINLVRPIDGGEGIVLIQKLPDRVDPPFNLLTNRAVPGALINPDGRVCVSDTTMNALTEVFGVDFNFYIAVVRINYNRNDT